jgi:virginiamycin B lyase
MNRKWLWMVLFALMCNGTTVFAQTVASQVWGVHATGQVSRWNGSDWVPVPGAANVKQVAVGNDGSVWGVNNAGHVVVRQADGQWQATPICLTQVSVGNAQNVWGIGPNQQAWHWNGAQWQPLQGKFSNVTAAADGTVWMVDSAGGVFRNAAAGQWQKLPGGPIQISAGSFHTAWGIAANQDILRWNGKQWQPVQGKLSSIAATADGNAWGVNSTGHVVVFAAGKWQQLPGALAQIAVSPGETPKPGANQPAAPQMTWDRVQPQKATPSEHPGLK